MSALEKWKDGAMIFWFMLSFLIGTGLTMNGFQGSEVAPFVVVLYGIGMTLTFFLPGMVFIHILECLTLKPQFDNGDDK